MIPLSRSTNLIPIHLAEGFRILIYSSTCLLSPQPLQVLLLQTLPAIYSIPWPNPIGSGQPIWYSSISKLREMPQDGSHLRAKLSGITDNDLNGLWQVMLNFMTPPWAHWA